MMRSYESSRGWPLMVAAAAAVLFGVYARFKGLGTWPLGVDEFYISRSIDFVMKTGLPEFPCGGIYPRGILYQYLVAGLRLSGLTPEFAGRLVTACASLLVLPAVYLLGRRLKGRTVGLIVVIIMALSVWEIEMARFARMYAPFQAIFAWYLVFFLRYTVDRDRSALTPMILLSILGTLIWEGGALMGLASLLPPLLNHRDGRLTRRDWIYLVGMSLLFVVLYVGATTDWRLHSEIPSFAEDAALPDGSESTGSAPLLKALPAHLGWLIAALLPLGVASVSLRWIWSLRHRWLAASGLALTLLAVLAHQLLLGAALIAILVLSRLVSWEELRAREARVYLLALAGSAAFWLLFGLSTHSGWTGAEASGTPKLVALIYQLAGFPGVIEELIRPWGRTLPLLSLCLLVAFVALAVRSVRDTQKPPTDISALLVLVVCMALIIGASGPPRHETRYAFFLYPLLITLAVCAIALLAERLARTEKLAHAMTVAAALLLFAVTEDFQPRHLSRIDSAEITFRVGMSEAQATHYYPRNDARRVATWLHENLKPGDIVVSGIPNVDQYFPGANYFFLDQQDDRYTSYACNRGTIERWSSLPLLYTTDALAKQVATGRRIFLILYPGRYDRLRPVAEARHWNMQVAWTNRGTTVMIINPSS
jgi:uncharacterized membrane protein YhaH (DUF805 family)